MFLTFDTQLSELNEAIKQINYQIGIVNTNANNISKEKTKLKKEICDIISDINSVVDVSQDIKTIVLTHDTVLRDEIIKQQSATLLTI